MINRALKKGVKIVVIILAVIAVLLIIAGIVLFGTDPKTKEIKNEGVVVEGSIAEIVELEIDNSKQYLLIRGHSQDNPVLLFLHGGPGQSEIGYIREYQAELEKHYIVVRWDQRGAGLSRDKNIPAESYSSDVFLKDTQFVTDYLLKRFNKSKILLSGHSWGSVLGLLSVSNFPEKYSGYIGIGQMVNHEEGEKLSWNYVCERAGESGNTEALKELESVGPDFYRTFEGLMTQRKWLGYFGGVFKNGNGSELARSLLKNSEYPFPYKLSYQKSALHSAKMMMEELYDFNFFSDVKEVKVPVWFISGEDDYATPLALVELYYKELKAPSKKLIIFENSAHMPQLEENERFNQLVISIKNQLL